MAIEWEWGHWLWQLEYMLTQDISIDMFGHYYDFVLWQFGVALGVMSFIVAVAFHSMSHPHRMFMSSRIGGFFSDVVIAPILEEIIYRLVLISVFTVILGSPMLAVVASAFLFGLGHVLYGGMKFVDSFVTGLLYGWAFVLVGLPVVIIAHMTHNFFASVTG